MTLPLNKKYAPMEALPAAELPEGLEWQYEPKWDGFRCLAFRDGAQIDLESKSGKPLTRYFPELAAALAALKAKKFVLDGEIVIPVDGHLSFDELLMRIHPAASRVLKLSQQHPCVFIVFDLLVDEKGKSLVKLPLEKRRAQLERLAKIVFDKDASISLSPVTDDLSIARKWFHMGVGLDGIVAKRKDLPYQTGERTGMQKIKKQRTADCAIEGFRYLEKKPLVGSLLLGLYNEEGLLDPCWGSARRFRRTNVCVHQRVGENNQGARIYGEAPGGLAAGHQAHSMEWRPSIICWLSSRIL